MSTDLSRRRGVRWIPDPDHADGGYFEMWCPDCAARHQSAWWPLTSEFWYVNRQLARCRACTLDRERKHGSGRYRSRHRPSRPRQAIQRDAFVAHNPVVSKEMI